MITVAIVDDHPIVRNGLKAMLAATPDIQLAGEGACGADALRIVAESRPDVLVLDLNLPDFDGLEVARKLCASEASPAILILTVHCETPLIFSALECGILGYVLKDEALETLVSAVRAVAQGENWLSPSVATQVVQHSFALPETTAQSAAEQVLLETLTWREREILQLLAQGLDNQAIAERLVLTRRTVQNHVSNIYAKLEVHSRIEAAYLAIRGGLAAPPEPGG